MDGVMVKKYEREHAQRAADAAKLLADFIDDAEAVRASCRAQYFALERRMRYNRDGLAVREYRMNEDRFYWRYFDESVPAVGDLLHGEVRSGEMHGIEFVEHIRPWAELKEEK